MKKSELEQKLKESERRVFELRASLAVRIGAAFDALPKAGVDKVKGSGVVLHITGLGGVDVVPPVVIRDGLSPATVNALQDDLRRSFELATLVSPAMARN